MRSCGIRWCDVWMLGIRSAECSAVIAVVIRRHDRPSTGCYQCYHEWWVRLRIHTRTSHAPYNELSGRFSSVELVVIRRTKGFRSCCYILLEVFQGTRKIPLYWGKPQQTETIFEIITVGDSHWVKHFLSVIARIKRNHFVPASYWRSFRGHQNCLYIAENLNKLKLSSNSLGDSYSWNHFLSAIVQRQGIRSSCCMLLEVFRRTSKITSYCGKPHQT